MRSLSISAVIFPFYSEKGLPFSHLHFVQRPRTVSVYNFLCEYLRQPFGQLLEAGEGWQHLLLNQLFAACQRKGLHLPSE